MNGQPCPSCGADVEVTTAEGDRFNWTTHRCSADCGYVLTFADGGQLDLGLTPGEIYRDIFIENFEELPPNWKPCIQVKCEPLP